MAAVCLAQSDLPTRDFAPAASAGGVNRPPLSVASASGWFRGPFCKIFPEDRSWVLQETTWGPRPGAQTRLLFATLSAAIAYAIDHGYQYKVIHAPQEVALDVTRSIASRSCANNSA
jgi:hypothetical protein